MSIPDTMQALQLLALGGLEQCTLPVPTPKPTEVLIRTVATTICTSDIADIAKNPFNIPLPRTLGHEGAGVIAAVGESVTGFSVGDRVASHPVISCGECPSCLSGFRHLCDNMGHLGIDRDGTFAEYYCMPPDRIRIVPDSITLPVAALLEPIAVCLEGVRRGRVSAGETVLIVGDGPFGLIMARLCLREPGVKLVLVGKNDFRLNHIPEITRLNLAHFEDIQQAVSDAVGSRGVDVAIMAAATSSAFDLCFKSLRPRGRVVVYSNIPGYTPVDLSRVHLKELEILGSCNDQDYIDEALACLLDKDLGLDGIITQRFPFAEWRTAFDFATHRKNEAIKVAITFS